MRVSTSILILLCLKIIFAFTQENEMQLTIDLVKSYEKPTAVNAFLCWKPCMKVKLVKQLVNLKRPLTIKYIHDQVNLQEFEPKDIIIADLSCPGVEDFLIEANKSTSFGSPYRWLIINHPDNITNIIPSSLKSMNILHDSEVILVQEKMEGLYEIHLIYILHTIQVWLTEYYGTWTSSLGLQKSDLITSTTKVLRRRNLAREDIVVGFNIDDKTTGSFSTDTDVKIRNSQHSITKWGFQQILPLIEFVNGTRINMFADNWGYFVNGSWNGLMGLMARGEADLSGTPIFMDKERMKHVKYISNVIETELMFVFREPPLSYQNNLFVLPFNKTVWYSLAGFVLLMMVVIYVNAQWETKKFQITDEVDENVRNRDVKVTLSDVAMMIVGAISQQGCFVELRGAIGRLVMFTLLLTFLFLFTAYSASIVALLQSSSKQIRTLSDLLNSRLELGVENTTYNVHYFTTATDPVRKAIYETKVAPKGSTPNFMSIKDGVLKLQKHPFAFNMDTGIGYRTIAEYFYEHEKCGLQEIKFISTTKPWLFCKRTSPYAELFQVGMSRIREHGLSDRVNRMVYARKPVCSVSGGSFGSVSIVDVYPSLLMLLYGTVLACSLMIAEILFHRRTVQNVDGF